MVKIMREIGRGDLSTRANCELAIMKYIQLITPPANDAPANPAPVAPAPAPRSPAVSPIDEYAWTQRGLLY